jgi:phosphoribosylanthranilate isomerase
MHPFNRMKLKVCGMRDIDNIRALAPLRPDYMGFIFYPLSKRAVGHDFVIPDDFPQRIKKVGVFVNEETSGILGEVKKHNLDFVQLHGDETPEQCAALRKAGLGLIKAFSMNTEFDFEKLEPYKMAVDFFLFDTRGETFGGTGQTFDWQVLRKYDQAIPFFLSGGLSPENIDKIGQLKGMNLHALDINSGFEVSPGIKNVAMVEELQMKRLKQHWLEY